MRWACWIAAAVLGGTSLWTMWFAIQVAGADLEGAIGNVAASLIAGALAVAFARHARGLPRSPRCEQQRGNGINA